METLSLIILVIFILFYGLLYVIGPDEWTNKTIKRVCYITTALTLIMMITKTNIF